MGAQIHVGSPKTHEMRSVPYPEFLELPIAKLCEGKPRDALLSVGGLDYLQRPRASGKSRSWFMTALDQAGLERMTVHDHRATPQHHSRSAPARTSKRCSGCSATPPRR